MSAITDKLRADVEAELRNEGCLSGLMRFVPKQCLDDIIENTLHLANEVISGLERKNLDCQLDAIRDCGTIAEQSKRIAELEAEVERLKAEAEDAGGRICDLGVQIGSQAQQRDALEREVERLKTADAQELHALKSHRLPAPPEPTPEEVIAQSGMRVTMNGKGGATITDADGTIAHRSNDANTLAAHFAMLLAEKRECEATAAAILKHGGSPTVSTPRTPVHNLDDDGY